MEALRIYACAPVVFANLTSVIANAGAHQLVTECCRQQFAMPCIRPLLLPNEAHRLVDIRMQRVMHRAS
jgi:hypothetical protein